MWNVGFVLIFFLNMRTMSVFIIGFYVITDYYEVRTTIISSGILIQHMVLGVTLQPSSTLINLHHGVSTCIHFNETFVIIMLFRSPKTLNVIFNGL